MVADFLAPEGGAVPRAWWTPQTRPASRPIVKHGSGTAAQWPAAESGRSWTCRGRGSLVSW